MLILSIIYAAVSGFSFIICLIYLPTVSMTIPVGIILVLNIISIFIKKNKKVELITFIVLGVFTILALLGGLAVLQAY